MTHVSVRQAEAAPLRPAGSPNRMHKRHPVPVASAALDWSATTPLTDFSFPWEQTPAPRTELRALWDAERLHFRFDCVDDDLVLGAGETVKERVLASDRVEIFFAPDLQLNPYFCLEMEPRGGIYAYRARSYRKFEDDFRFEGLELSASVDGSRYAVQGSLPLATLRSLGVLKPGRHELFAGIYRAEFSHQPDGGVHFGWMSWVDPQTETPDFHVPSSFGVLELVS
jgi:hypothetical protein